jgi:outer membrane protein assembly factor BamD
MLRNVLYLFFGSCCIVSCSQYNKIEKTKDVNKKLAYANSLYDHKKYTQANALYEELIKVFQGTKNSPDLLYRYAYSYFYIQDYTSSAFYFKNFGDNYPNDPRSVEADYMQAYSYYELSPRPELDQANTDKALDAMQEFVNAHPESDKDTEADKIIDECHKKLEQKLYLSAVLYYNIEQYKAAAVYFNSLLRNYPDSDLGDMYKFMVIKSEFRYASNSIIIKQNERFSQVVTDYLDFADSFPNSKYLKEAEKYYNQSQSTIKTIKDEQNKTGSGK